MTLSNSERKLLKALQQDVTLSQIELAERSGLSV